MLARLEALMRHKRAFPQADGKLIEAGTSVPADASTGYQTGCLYQKTDGGVGSSLYVNHGSLSSSLFQPVEAVGSAQNIIQLPMCSWQRINGIALAVFANGASDVPGYSATAEAMGIRWNNHAAPLAISTQVAIPPDLDATANIVFHALVAKSGATVGDATTLTVAAFNNVPAALYDADADFGGATDAITGDATAKTVTEVTRALALANLNAAPCVLQLQVKPTAGLLGTDDLFILGAWLEYTKKALVT